MSEATTFQQAAEQNLQEVNDRIAEIREKIDYQQCCDPNYSMDDCERELFEEMERLLMSRSDLKKIAEDGLP